MERRSKDDYTYVKVIVSKGQKIVAACDEEILGRIFREGKLKLEINENFYKGYRITMDKAIELINNADIANLSGKTIVKAAVEYGLVDIRAITRISGIPHVQILKL